MTQVPPQTSLALADDDSDGDDGSGDGPEICGAELSGGGTCDRPATECPYHE